MAIRPVVYDPDDPTGGPDVALILRLLAETPNPPNEDAETIGAILDDTGQITFIDLAMPVFVRMSPRPDQIDDDGNPAPDVIVVWWVWEGDFISAAHLPVLGVCARAVLKAFPQSATWPIWGDFPGEGDTEAERKADSIRQAQEHSSWLGSLTDVDSPNNAKMQQGRSTLAAVIAVIPAVA